MSTVSPLASVFRPTRSRVLQELAQPSSAAAVARRLEMPRQQVSYHLKQLEREGRIVQVDGDLWFAAAPMEEARSLLRKHAEAYGQIDAATFRDLLGASRKFSIALLDYFDRTGFTMRVGDMRRLRKS